MCSPFSSEVGRSWQARKIGGFRFGVEKAGTKRRWIMSKTNPTLQKGMLSRVGKKGRQIQGSMVRPNQRDRKPKAKMFT